MKATNISRRIIDEVGESSAALFADAVGVSRQNVYHWMKGNIPSPIFLKRLASYWGEPIEIQPEELEG